ncbi:hypothetical protein CDD80_4895 [Ophiocordyceps camponoti-rufipedis]|uniref:MPN domain-containing protein n=1 Tax=Ophiocordyceps camponoti-rufipedis TaxID=2004952 RepID=A0A2C5YT33_9HYPO|nr:hypothetical protein CDD80_4895 [Ophiocordyceps camponoti-rufipedis]
MPTTTAETLSLVTRNVSVAPLVLLSAVDHYNRNKTKRRVVGVLLGQNDGKNVRVSNSFAVPFEEDEKDPSVWFLDHNYVESMNDMFKKVNAREKLIGWYHSGPKLRASDLKINDLFKRYTPNPLLVIIDVQPKESGVPTDAYFAVEEIKDDVFNLLPNLSSPEGDGKAGSGDLAHAMSMKTNDQLMAIYLSSLIRAITAFHDLIENKIQNRQQQEEKDSKKDDSNSKDEKDNGQVTANGDGGVKEKEGNQRKK